MGFLTQTSKNFVDWSFGVLKRYVNIAGRISYRDMFKLQWPIQWDNMHNICYLWTHDFLCLYECQSALPRKKPKWRNFEGNKHWQALRRRWKISNCCKLAPSGVEYNIAQQAFVHISNIASPSISNVFLAICCPRFRFSGKGSGPSGSFKLIQWITPQLQPKLRSNQENWKRRTFYSRHLLRA